ncbi:MAG: DUF3108 domain-containing protein [Calditrichia bacterium]
MKRSYKFFTIIILYIGTLSSLLAQSNKSDNITQTDSLLLNKKVVNRAFTVGEKLHFVVRYGFIHAGTARMEVKELFSYQNRPVYRITSSARSNGTFDHIFKVRDSVETWLDAEGLFSWKFVKKLREGGYKFDLNVDYLQEQGLARVHTIRYESDEPLRIRNQDSLTIKVPYGVLDILSSFYFVRTQRLRPGMPIYITNHDNKKVYDLKVLVQKRETINTRAGKFRCIVVQPMLKGEAIFKQKGKLWVWLTDDEYKIPIQMKSAVFIGNITTELTKIEGLPLPLPSQLK